MSNETYAPTSAPQKTTSGCCGGARKNAAAEEEARYHALRTLNRKGDPPALPGWQ